MGQECNGGQCVCDGTSCGTGCCNGTTCEPGYTNQYCGWAGGGCATCSGGDHCKTNRTCGT